MALTRKFLAAMGIEADKIEEIITAHTESLEGVKSERDRYKADAVKLPDVQKELDALKNGSGENPFEKKYNDEHKAFEDFKKEVSAKELKAKKEAAYKEILKDAGVSEKGVAKVLKYTDWDSVELDDEGKIKDAKKHIKDVKEEWSELIVQEGAKGAQTAHPPKTTGGSGKTKEEIFAIKNPIERQKAIAENHELFGF